MPAIVAVKDSNGKRHIGEATRYFEAAQIAVSKCLKIEFIPEERIQLLYDKCRLADEHNLHPRQVLQSGVLGGYINALTGEILEKIMLDEQGWRKE